MEIVDISKVRHEHNGRQHWIVLDQLYELLSLNSSISSSIASSFSD